MSKNSPTIEEKNIAIAEMLGWLFFTSERKWVIPKSLDIGRDYKEWADTTNIAHGEEGNRYSLTHYMLSPSELEFHSNANWQFEAIDWVESQGYPIHIIKKDVIIKQNNTISSPSVYNGTKVQFSSKKEAIFEALYQFSQYLKQHK